ncbi:MAG TPA: NADH-quinone oxidoreductase subunit NuoE [Syntrophomonadaceae bacterium]|jgi:NADH-quinone oxidoreductase subunit E|nr:NADH-quinone oxidoreductase subunit NuoE [Syntrophomonadaceae bacterium]HRX21365.1 NADH-quinone oxidoreductase subunit NuoE [Syntrophomonadaceae bacterium]
MCNCNETIPDLRYAALEKTLEKYQGKSGKIIPALQETQEIFGYLPDDAIKAIAAALKVPSSEIFGVATFYGQFHLQARGKNIIRVCTGTACHVQGSGKILDAITQTLGLTGGMMTTEDLLFTVEPVACLGACGMAPVIMINEEAYGRVSPDDVPEILAQYQEKDGKEKCIA